MEPYRERIEDFIRRYGVFRVLAVGVVALVLLFCGLFVLWYRNPLVPSPPPLISRPEPLPAEDSVTVPTPPSKTHLEPKTGPEGGKPRRGGDRGEDRVLPAALAKPVRRG